MPAVSQREVERIVIGGQILVTIAGCSGKPVRLGMSAPRGIPIDKEDVFEQLTGKERHDLVDRFCTRLAPHVESN